jgi:hypothetical protein
MSSEQPRKGRDTAGSGGAPLGSTAAIIIAVLAVIGGFLILREIRSSSSDSAPATTAATTVPETAPPTAAPTEVPTTAPQVFTGATVIVANASKVNGAAGVLTTSLKKKGFTTVSGTNAAAPEDKLDVSKVYYDPTNPNALAVANTVAGLMGNIAVAVLPTPPPVKDGKLPVGVAVLVMLGADKANLTLDEMGTATTVATATSVATATTVAAVTIPAVAPSTSAG